MTTVPFSAVPQGAEFVWAGDVYLKVTDDVAVDPTGDRIPVDPEAPVEWADRVMTVTVRPTAVDVAIWDGLTVSRSTGATFPFEAVRQFRYHGRVQINVVR